MFVCDKNTLLAIKVSYVKEIGKKITLTILNGEKITFTLRNFSK